MGVSEDTRTPLQEFADGIATIVSVIETGDIGGENAERLLGAIGSIAKAVAQ